MKLTSKKLGLLTVGLARVLNNGVVFLITLILVRFGGLSTSQIGAILYVLGLLTIISIFTDFGMTEGIQKFVNQTDPKKILGPALLLELIIVTIVGILIAVFDINGLITRGQNWLFFGVVVMSIYNIIILSFNGLHQQLKASVYQIGYVLILLTSLCINFFVLGMEGLQSALLSFLIAWGIMNIAMVLDLWRGGLIEPSLHIPTDFIKFCLNNFVYIACFLVLTQTDILFIAFQLGDSQAGIYRSTAQIALFTRIIGLAVSTPLLPIFSRLVYEKNWFKLRKIYILVQIFVFLCVGIMFISATFFGQGILQLLYNNSEVALTGGVILPLLVAALGIQSLNMPTIMLFQAFSRERIVRNGAIIQCSLYIVAMALLTRYNLIYPALILLALELLVLPFYYFKVNRLLGVFKTESVQQQFRSLPNS